jgi:hypothetical protein
MPISYEGGKVYAVVSESAGLRYIGSTCQGLSQRMAQHRSQARTKNKYGYTACQLVMEHADAHIILLEAFPCSERYELLARQAYHVSRLECVNKRRPLKDGSASAAEKREAEIVARNTAILSETVGADGSILEYVAYAR